MPKDLPFLVGLLLATALGLVVVAMIAALGRLVLVMLRTDFRWHRHRKESQETSHHRRMAQLQSHAITHDGRR